MKKWQWFVSSLIILTGSLIFLSLFTYSGTMVYSTWLEEEKFEPQTQLADMDISGLTQEQAAEKIDARTAGWQAERAVELRWFDQSQSYDTEELTFNSHGTVERLNNKESNSGEIKVSGDEQYLIEVLGSFKLYSEPETVVNTEALLNDLEKEAAALPAHDIVVNVHEYVNEDKVNKASSVHIANRTPGSPELEVLASELSPVVIEGDSTFSLLEVLQDVNTELTDEKAKSVIGSAIYELLLHSNFDLIERTQSESLAQSMPLGYDVKISQSDQLDLVFENPNPSPYVMEFEVVNNSLQAELTGEEFPYLIEVDIENQEEIKPKTVVHYTERLGKGATETVETGSDGVTYSLSRTIVNPLNDNNEAEYVASDYFPPVHRVEMRSKEDFIEEEEEPVEPGNDEFFDGSGGGEEAPSSEGQPGGQEWGEDPWNDGSGGSFNGEGDPGPGGSPDGWQDSNGDDSQHREGGNDSFGDSGGFDFDSDGFNGEGQQEGSGRRGDGGQWDDEGFNFDGGAGDSGWAPDTPGSRDESGYPETPEDDRQENGIEESPGMDLPDDEEESHPVKGY
ncbi:VanW family protein [Salipaludibacillus aurantiacus]|uniref:VanW like protein n=1 Tax=Salipaludibacillus aurantiacus TaxID=1601833 RepID=A0A1H9T5C6_9BACI|nr:VanW family protein [Salipaludibacillus aurantiacus]SER92297.1 VanW like protein [Salipaludibacillus aurantiacus]